MARNSILSCDRDLRKKFYSNIILNGGNNRFKGMSFKKGTLDLNLLEYGDKCEQRARRRVSGLERRQNTDLPFVFQLEMDAQRVIQ